MAVETGSRPSRTVISKRNLVMVGSLAAVGAVVVWPNEMLAMARFVGWGLFSVAPLLAIGIVLSAWVQASGASDHITDAFSARTVRAVLFAAAVGAVSPVCGVTVLPLMAGLLLAGVPLAPVMAFWLASPITDPGILSATIATLGLEFAIGKTAAALGLGILGGLVTALFVGRSWYARPLRDNGLVAGLAQRPDCGDSCGPAVGSQIAFVPMIWRDKERRGRFARLAWANLKLVVVCLVPAFAAEFLLNRALTPTALAAYVGEQNVWAVPLAVFVGAPAYLDGYAALPLTRGLIDHGMAPGAAMGFLVSGGVVSIWGAMAIAPVLRLIPFALYLVLALAGSLAAGWGYGWIA